MIWFSIVNYLKEKKILSKFLRFIITKYISLLLCIKDESCDNLVEDLKPEPAADSSNLTFGIK